MRRSLSCAVVALLGWSAPALAQGTASAADEVPALEEIIVTAQKRVQNLQQVPIVVNSVSADVALARGISGTTDLPTIAPGLQFNRTTNAGLVFLRGVGGGFAAAGQEGPVAFYLDDVYVYSLNGNMFDLNNIERLEVLSGPQGTLFGRNALGGVIQIITKEPTDAPSLDARIGYGNYDTLRADLYATGALAPDLTADLSILYMNQGEGFGRNLATGKDVFKTRDFSARSKLLWSPTDTTSVQFSLLHDRYRSDVGVSSRLLPGSTGRDGSTAPADFYDVNQNLQSGTLNKQWLPSLRLIHDFGDVSLKNVLAYQDNRTTGTYDIDQTPRPINEHNPLTLFSKTWSNELQLSSNNGSGEFSWIVGLFYLNNKSGYDPVRIFSNPPNIFGSYFDLVTDLDTESYAGYAQATLPLGEATNVTGGIRYTHDEKQVSGGNIGQNGRTTNASREDDWGKLSYRLSLDHQFTKDTLGYVAYNRGFKAGTFNTTAPADPGVEPEVIDDYEIGLKTELLDRRLRLNTAAFYYNYNGIQLRRVTPSGIILLNAAKAEHYGIDASIEAVVTDAFRVQAGMEWLHAEFKSFPNAPATARAALGNVIVNTDYSGRRMLSAPKFVGTIGAQYKVETAHGDLNFAGNYSYNDGFSWSLEVDDRIHEKKYGLLNLSVMWTSLSGEYDVRLWGKNVTGTKYNVFAITSANGDYGSPGDPATVGVTLGIHF